MKKNFSNKELTVYGITFLVLFISGITWLILHYFCKSSGEFGLETHPMESKILVIHGICGIVFMFIFGAIWEKHAKSRLKKKKKSGKINTILLIITTVTVPVLYYIGSDFIRNIASVIHWVCGIALLVTLLYHGLTRSISKKSNDYEHLYDNHEHNKKRRH